MSGFDTVQGRSRDPGRDPGGLETEEESWGARWQQACGNKTGQEAAAGRGVAVSETHTGAWQVEHLGMALGMDLTWPLSEDSHPVPSECPETPD